VLDGGEVVRQSAQNNTTIATLAVGVLLAHVALAALAAFVLLRSWRGSKWSFS
jgi:hypothetical protein